MIERCVFCLSYIVILVTTGKYCMRYTNYFTKLRSATLEVPIPKTFQGITDVANFADSQVKRFQNVFWNTPSRHDLESDAKFIAMVISILKKRAGKIGADCALEIIKLLESKNAY